MRSRYDARSPLACTIPGCALVDASRSTLTTTPVSSSASRAAAWPGSSPGSGIPVIGVHAPLSARRTSRISSPRVTTAVTPGSHISCCPIILRISTMNSGIGIPPP